MLLFSFSASAFRLHSGQQTERRESFLFPYVSASFLTSHTKSFPQALHLVFNINIVYSTPFCFVGLSPVLSCLLITFCISFPCLRQRFRQTRISLALSLFAHLTENQNRLHHLNKVKMVQR